MDLKDLLPYLKDSGTLLIAFYGATLATITFIAQRREKVARLKVRGALGFQVSGLGVSETLLMLEAANVGHVPITISSYGLGLPDGRIIVVPFSPQQIQLPYELTAGKSCTMHLPVRDIANGLLEHGYRGKVKLVPRFSDQTGKVHQGRSIDADTESWRKGA